jgi:uncharacterized protein (UPF0261 family)
MPHWGYRDVKFLGHRVSALPKFLVYQVVFKAITPKVFEVLAFEVLEWATGVAGSARLSRIGIK